MKNQDTNQPFDPQFVEDQDTYDDIYVDEDYDEDTFVDSECEEPQYDSRKPFALKFFIAICFLEIFVLFAFIGSQLVHIPWGTIGIILAILLLLIAIWLWGYYTHAEHCKQE